MHIHTHIAMVLLLALAGGWALSASDAAGPQVLSFRARKLVETPAGSDHWQVIETPVKWRADQTAVVICDMWDKHWCRGATARVAEMAPRMNLVITALRRRGVLIIHCPSDTMAYYADAPGRKLAQSAPPATAGGTIRDDPPHPIDASDGGCDDDPPCPQGSPWRREIATLDVKEGDAITDSAEAYNLMVQRGIRNVIVMGVHENMCILNRPFSIRQMVGQGQNVLLMRDMTDTMYNSRRRPWVDHFTGNDLMTWHIEKYWCPTITSDQVLGGRPFRFAGDTKPPRVFRNFVRLPAGDVHYKQVRSYVEDTPHPDYRQASDAAREAFRDLKFGVRIHWGVYAELGVDASWPFLGMTNEKRQEYQELYKQFNPVEFSAEEWMRLFQRDGVRIFAFTSKHHDGFSMFDTRTRVKRRTNWTAPGGPALEECDTAYSIMDTPFHRDIIKELADAAHRHGIKIDLYFSHPDWYDADFRPYAFHPVQIPAALADPAGYGNAPPRGKYLLAPDPTPAEVQRMLARHRAQLTELLTRYGKIDCVCLDQWLGPAVWPAMREEMKALRKLQPDVMFRCRGVGNYGDYYTPEGFVPGAKENTTMPWMVIYQLTGQWSYDPDPAHYKGGDWVVRNLVDAVAKGGNFMVGIGPDARGKFPPKAVEALDYAGAWLRVNGEAIYATRPREGDLWREGSDVRFTRAKDGKRTYAICLSWPGRQLILQTLKARAGSKVTLLGYAKPLAWRNDDVKGLVVELPDDLQEESRRPCRQAYAFRIEGETREIPLAPGTRRINFQPRATPVPAGWLADCGDAFGDRGLGQRYGWSSDAAAETRQRKSGQIEDTFCHFRAGQKWELALANGTYRVTVTVGDAAYESTNTLNVEGVSFCSGLALQKETRPITKRVVVVDGRLTLDCGDSPDRQTKIAAIEVVPDAE